MGYTHMHAESKKQQFNLTMKETTISSPHLHILNILNKSSFTLFLDLYHQMYEQHYYLHSL